MPQVRFPQLKARVLGVALCFGVAAFGVMAAEVGIRADSPNAYTVTEGDTLWDIAGRFLEQPWLWPQVWQVNPQIDNPDLIYPGDVIELSYENGSPVLRLSDGSTTSASGARASVGVPSGIRTVRLTPEIRRETLLSPIPSIPLDRISAFLSDNSVVDPGQLETAPYILGEREGRNLATRGDEIMARGPWTPGVLTYDVVRPGRELRDPDTGLVLGLEALYVGSATIETTNGQEAFMRIDDTTAEVRMSDRLLPRQASELDPRYFPHTPEFAVDAAIAAIGNGRSVGGNFDTLVLNRGSSVGIESGQVLTVEEPPVQVTDSIAKASPWLSFKRVLGFDASGTVEFPGESIATVLVYRVFADSSLAIVLDSSQPIRLDDRVVTPR